MKHLLAAGLTLSITASCARSPHVTLQAPDATATSEQRLKAYAKLSPDRMVQRMTTTNGTVTSLDYSELSLNDGTIVYHAEDLLPVVPEDSLTAQAVRAQMKTRKTRNIVKWIGPLGLGYALYSFVQADSDDTESAMSQALIGGSIGLVGTLITGFLGRREALKNKQAMTAYEQSLRQRLNLCKEGEHIYPCESEPDTQEGDISVQFFERYVQPVATASF